MYLGRYCTRLPITTAIFAAASGSTLLTRTSSSSLSNVVAAFSPIQTLQSPASLSFRSTTTTGDIKHQHFTISSPKKTSRKMSSNSSPSSPVISISEAFDGGNGRLLKVDRDDDGQTTVHVEIRKDPYTKLEKKHHFQYFSFRSTVGSLTEPTEVKYVLSNAGDASYPKAWEGSTTFFSTAPSDPLSWTRKTNTTYDSASGHLSWTHAHAKDESVYFSYFPPYSYERHLNLVSKVQSDPSDDVRVRSLGRTLDGREMECVEIGTGDRICWIIHRQHPGETMAEFYAEGLLNRLLGTNTGYSLDGTARRAREMYTFYIVPNMCPDGAFRGHLRTNADGQNLNREWESTAAEGADDEAYEAPTLERSPEVYHVLKRMDETGCDVFLDVHGDEELPFNFLAGSEGCPNWSPRLSALHGAFLGRYAMVNSDMQVPVAYEPEDVGMGRMNVCSNQIAKRFDCLSATLEMPFKDCRSNPDGERGWSPARAMQLGASVLDPLVFVCPYLREEGEFWSGFGKELAYVRPTSSYK